MGAGIAGLRSSMLLERAGHEVRLFEARQRLGGRMQTSSLGDEAGGEWIDGDHERCLALLREMGIEATPPDAHPRLFVYEGHRCTSESLWPDALEHEIRMEAAARDLCRELHRPAWDNWQARALDEMTLAEFIDRLSTTPRGRWYLRAVVSSDEGDDPERIGMLGWLTAYMNYLDRRGGEMSAFRVCADEVIGKMASSLQAEVVTGRVLIRVEGGTLHFEGHASESFDAVVLTLPPRSLEKVVFDPPVTPEKRCAIESCRMSQTVKLSYEFRTKWWLEEGWGGAMQCDLPIQQTWDGSRGDRAVLSVYVCGSACEAWAERPDAIDWGLEQLTSLFPAARAQFLRGEMHDWNADPLARGGFSHTAPGYVLNHMRHVSTPEGVILFAGEHTSPWLGFIEGALESAERICHEIDALH
ncbi:MAG: flavin monoamine oxidase family protein [Fimbriimonas sp.]